MAPESRHGWIAAVAAALQLIAAAGLIAMTVITVADVTLRYLFLSPIYGSSEMISLLLAAVVFAGLALAAERNEHICVSLFEPLLIQRFGRAYVLMRHLANTGGMVLVAVLMARHARVVGHNDSTTIVLEWPLYPVAVILVGLAAAAVIMALAGWWRGESGDVRQVD